MQQTRRYLAASAAIFAFVAIAHVVRAIEQWPIVIADWNVPNALSWLAAIVAACLSAWAVSLRRHAR